MIAEKFNLFGLQLKAAWNPLSYAEQWLWSPQPRPFFHYLLGGLLLCLVLWGVALRLFQKKDLSRWFH